MRYRLRTLLIVLAVLPPLLAAAWIAITGVAGVAPDIGEALSMLLGLALAITMAVGLGFAVARIGNAVIGLWNDR